MAFAGLKKQINKANQYVTEKMGGAEGTKLDLDFMDMERKTDVTVELVEELQLKTKEFLQPNPTARAKMAAVKGISKLSGQAKSNTYPQPEGVLGDCLLLYGKKLGEDSAFAQGMIEMGESMKQMADVKYSLDDNIKQNFLEPLHHLQTKDLKEVMHHRKKLQGRRLDFDCKRRRQAKVGRPSPYSTPTHNSYLGRPDDEIKQAEEKFAESLHLAQLGMFNLLDNEVEQLAQLTSFADGLLEYHQQCVEILNSLVVNLRDKTEEAGARPKMEFVPKTLADLHIDGISTDGSHGFNNGRTSQSHALGGTYGSNNSISSRPHSNNSSNNNLRHSSSIGNLSSRQTNNAWSVPNNNGGSRIASSQSASFHDKKANSNNLASKNSSVWGGDDPFNAPWERSGANGLSANYQSRGAQPPRRPPVQQRVNLDPWSGGSNAGSPIHKPNNLELFPGGNNQNNARSTNASPLPSPMKSPARTPMVPPPAKGPCCTALYDFEPENPGELGFKENDVITLVNKVDDNWFEGTVNGRTGYFPVSYVTVTVPLP